METLERFIVKAKANGWVGASSDGRRIPHRVLDRWISLLKKTNSFIKIHLWD
ncbi:hypothetical protein WDW86_15970 [Bdellovibrionota bacterium FG-2]